MTIKGIAIYPIPFSINLPDEMDMDDEDIKHVVKNFVDGHASTNLIEPVIYRSSYKPVEEPYDFTI